MFDHPGVYPSTSVVVGIFAGILWEAVGPFQLLSQKWIPFPAALLDHVVLFFPGSVGVGGC